MLMLFEVLERGPSRYCATLLIVGGMMCECLMHHVDEEVISKLVVSKWKEYGLLNS